MLTFREKRVGGEKAGFDYWFCENPKQQSVKTITTHTISEGKCKMKICIIAAEMA